jgi:hypothetical protein
MICENVKANYLKKKRKENMQINKNLYEVFNNLDECLEE